MNIELTLVKDPTSPLHVLITLPIPLCQWLLTAGTKVVSDIPGFCSFNQVTKQLWPNDNFKASTLLIPNKPISLITRPTTDLRMQSYRHISNQTVIV